ncbi:SCO7613 C-terminal domain-containing membrane protein [Streptomyces sp. NPDC059618]|uniref:SCO7613 C-terminal domain-containing membrane protein n=1 Tax=Streptomyces sp. NPDC059618 TaxID=3346887 RepID=UPI0036AD12A8
MTQIPSPAEELRLLDTELRQLDARRAVLLTRRAWLVHALRPAPAPTAPPVPGARRPEATAPGLQNVLLLLGGVLLAVAAVAFTLVGWGHLGIAGRSLVLGAVTLAALAAPVPLLRRGLRSTAEALAGTGLVLTVLDAYALYAVVFPGTDGAGYAALASTALAVLWAAYGVALGSPPRKEGAGTRPSLRLPLPAAVAAVQPPLVLWAVAASAGAYAVTAALLATAALDLTLALRLPGRSVRIAAAVGAYALGGWGTFAGACLSAAATGPGAAARAAALLFLAAAIALTAAWRAPAPNLTKATATGLTTAGGLAGVGAIGGVLRVSLPGAWTVPGLVVCGIALLAAAGTRLPAPVRRGSALASAGVGALAVAWALPAVALALLGPAGRLGSVWSGAPSNARDAVTGPLPWPQDTATAPLVLALLAAALVPAARAAAWRPHALTAALGLAWATALVLPAALELPYAAALSVQGLTTAALLEYARRSASPLTARVLALLTSLGLAFLALASEGATLTVLAALTVLFTAAAPRSGPVPFAPPAALGYGTALVCAAGASLGLQPQHTALLVLVVPVTAALLAARTEDGAATLSIEITGALAGLLAIALAVSEPPLLATVLALCGLVCAGTAVREGRRPVQYAAVALFVLASWVRLASWGVGSPEAYTLPVTVPALLLGVYRRRSDTSVSSWTAYAPGLSVTLAPSLFTAWIEGEWQRPLLLGAAALAVTLLGARHRLQAPLLLGGAVLVLDALHELAPYIVQIVDALPRWTPPALAGVLLLALGATYEQRIRDARRVRDVLGRMD